jgi:putative effector of murein hydrolase LrgA (UPF0299 family)
LGTQGTFYHVDETVEENGIAMKKKELFNPFLLLPPYIALFSASIVFFIPILYYFQTLHQKISGFLANLTPGIIIGLGLFLIVGTIEWERYKAAKRKRIRYLISTFYGVLFLPLMLCGIAGSMNNNNFMLNWLAALCAYAFVPAVVLMVVQVNQRRIIPWEEMNGRHTLKFKINGTKIK